jgi:hypothetical protein
VYCVDTINLYLLGDKETYEGPELKKAMNCEPCAISKLKKITRINGMTELTEFLK